MHKSTNGDGQTNTYTHDADDRVKQLLSNGATTCTYSTDGCINYQHSSAGYLDTQHDAYGIITYVYDMLDRLTTEELPGGANACPGSSPSSIVYSYDDANNLISYCDGGGTDSYTYDPANNLSGVATEGGSCTPGSVVQPCTRYTRDNNNQVTKISWPTSTDNAVENLTYFNNGQTHTLSSASGPTPLDSLTYSYQLAGNIDSPLLQSVKNNVTGITTSYTYNSREQLTAATPTSGTSYGYTYGLGGNMTQQSTNGTVTLQASQMPTGQLCWTLTSANGNSCASPPSGSTAYSYDASGNETGNTPPSGTAESLSYNPLSQTASMTATGSTTTLAMGYTGADSTERTTAGATTLTNNAFGVASSTDNSGTYFTYNPGNTPNTLASILVGGPSGTGARYYYLYDALGNVIGLMDSTGTSQATYTYSPFGRTTSTGTDANLNPIRYQGGYHDNDGWDKFGDRYYNPTTMLWTQPDPKAPTINNPASYLLYSFNGNDPINNSDPAGEDDADDIAIGLVVGGAAVAGAGLFLSAGVLGAGLGLVDLAGEAIGGTIGEEAVSVSAVDVAGTVAQFAGAAISTAGAVVAGLFG